MPNWLRQNTTAILGIGPFLDITDGVTPETALSITQSGIRLKKNGDDWGPKNHTGSGWHEEYGWYEITLNATDTNQQGRLLLSVYKTGEALPVWHEYMVVPSSIYDAMVSGTEWLHVDSFKPDWSVSGSILTVKKPDDTTVDYTKNVSTTAGVDPVTGAQ